MTPIFLPASSKIKLLALCLGSLLFLIKGLKARDSGGNLQRRLLVPTGLAGLLYVVLELCWYFYIAFLHSREIALAYYFGFRLWGGIVAGMFLYVIFRNAKVFLAASTVLLVAFNVFVIARHLGGAVVLVGHADGLFGGMFIASLVLLRLDQRQDQHLNAESAMAPTTAEKKPQVLKPGNFTHNAFRMASQQCSECNGDVLPTTNLVSNFRADYGQGMRRR